MNDAMRDVVHVRTKRWVNARAVVPARRFACYKSAPSFVQDHLASHIALGVRTGIIVPLWLFTLGLTT